MKIAAIVEGHGEVASLPILLRRIAQWRTPARYSEVLRPILVKRNQFLNREQEFHRYLQLAAGKAGDEGCVLILLDADDDCPAQLGTTILHRAQDYIPHRHVSVVLANREYEAWFIAAAASLDGERGFALRPSDHDADPESPRSAKDWMGSRMPRDTVKQPTSLHSLHVSICSWPTTAAARSANCAASGTGWDTDVPPGNPVIHETRPGTAGHDTPPAPPTDM